jgi:hypothetical protein
MAGEKRAASYRNFAQSSNDSADRAEAQGDSRTAKTLQRNAAIANKKANELDPAPSYQEPLGFGLAKLPGEDN